MRKWANCVVIRTGEDTAASSGSWARPPAAGGRVRSAQLAGDGGVLARDTASSPKTGQPLATVREETWIVVALLKPWPFSCFACY